MARIPSIQLCRNSVARTENRSTRSPCFWISVWKRYLSGRYGLKKYQLLQIAWIRYCLNFAYRGNNNLYYRELLEILTYCFKVIIKQSNWRKRLKKTQPSVTVQKLHLNKHMWNIKIWLFQKERLSLQNQDLIWAIINTSFITWIKQEFDIWLGWIWRGSELWLDMRIDIKQ